MHPLLARAIKAPRMPRPYGAGHDDNLFGQAYDGYIATDRYIKRNIASFGNFQNKRGSAAELIAAGYKI